MAYTGSTIPIDFGQLGLKTDDPMTALPPNCAILANNISLTSSRVEKSKGSVSHNLDAPLTAGVVGIFDWFPEPGDQRLIALTRDGKLWRDTGDGTFDSQTPIATGLGTLTTDCHMIAAGNEDASQNRKLFCFFNGASQAKFIDGDDTALTAFTNIAVDWTSSFPTFGLVVKDRLVVFGNANDKHRVYWSTASDHSDFTGTGSGQLPIFPGESDGLAAAVFYKGLVFLFKRPLGVYIMDPTDPDPLNWTASKLSDAFGISAPHAGIQMLDDLVCGSSSGSITSLQATSAFGDLKTGDILATAQVEQYFRDNLSTSGIAFQSALYYPERKIAYFSGRYVIGNPQNRLIAIDVSRPVSRITFETKDQPTCLALRKDTTLIDRPMYGTETGFVRFMDQPVYNVDGVAYNGEFQTPFMDFSSVDASLASKNKLFDFLEVQYSPTGNYNFFVDVLCDGRFVETLVIRQAVGAVMGEFILGLSRLGGPKTRSVRLPIHCSGKSISFKVYNNLVNQNFKLEKLLVSLRLSGEQQDASAVT